MDPIHPILPVPPNIPPVTEAPRVGKLDRDQRRDQGRDDKRPAQRRPPGRDAASDDSAPDAEPRPHIDVTA
jgi:hypothetical protein